MQAIKTYIPSGNIYSYICIQKTGKINNTNTKNITFGCLQQPCDTKAVSDPKELWAQRLFDEYTQKFPRHMENLRKLFPENLGIIQGRVKDKSSIKDSIRIASSGGAKIEGVPLLSATINNIDDARESIPDILGTRILLYNGNKENVDIVVNKLADLIKNKEVSIEKIFNCRGEGIPPYLDNEQLARLQEVSGTNIDIHNTDKEGGGTGFTCAIMNLVHKDGTKSEFKIIDKQMQDLETIHHIYFDYEMGKDLTKGVPEIKELVTPLLNALDNLSAKDKAKYRKYWLKCYQNARQKGLGINNTEKPQLPDSINCILSLESLTELNKEYEKLKRKHLY